ncbi:hypothetical protein C8Q75DRAFT_890884 [Abortiporus biennis]|nr:hypothetical protein C8Q75DRAFT_890884 [Abortiporus biennis]
MAFSALPPAEKGVCQAECTVFIDAPIEKVWQVLTDFPSYSKWNTFVFSQVMVDSTSDRVPLESQYPTEGKHLLMTCHIPLKLLGIPITITSKPYELVNHVDDTNCLLAWKYVAMPQWFNRAQRWQALSVVEDPVTGTISTKYETREVFGGPAAYLIKWFLLKGLMKSFQNMGQNLKDACEKPSNSDDDGAEPQPEAVSSTNSSAGVRRRVSQVDA